MIICLINPQIAGICDSWSKILISLVFTILLYRIFLISVLGFMGTVRILKGIFFFGEEGVNISISK